MTKVIQDYTKGSINVNKFREQLADHKIPVDANMDKLIRKHEAGDFVSYNEFGKHIFRKLNGYRYFLLLNDPLLIHSYK